MSLESSMQPPVLFRGARYSFLNDLIDAGTVFDFTFPGWKGCGESLKVDSIATGREITVV